MSNIIPFNFNSNSVRVIQKDGEPWFVAKDVAETLGYSRARDAIKQHCKGAVKHRLPSASGYQETMLIPERDVYRLIMRSKLPEAEAFEEWVVGEVLPSIRKTGHYKIPETMSEALRFAADQFDEAQRAKEKLEVADQEIQRLQGVCETIAAQFTPGMTIPSFCRQLNGVNIQKVQSYLAGRGMLLKYKGNRFKSASYYRDHYFTEKPYEYERSDGSKGIKFDVVLTMKGAVAIYKLYLKGDLPMKAKWDGSHTHCLFDDKPQ
ncbi:MAG: transporter [Halomonas sp.]|nr:transporter [Halomonas sp.]|tara:strand:- start:14869 stop:15657 length:789 start_codon:yes stop_codon:yes gene_type:complete